MNETPPYQKHSGTSIAAAYGCKTKAASLRSIVLEEIAGRSSGVTDEELFYIIKKLDGWENVKDSTVRARRIELMQAGVVSDSGEQRDGRSGAKMVVWKISERQQFSLPSLFPQPPAPPSSPSQAYESRLRTD